MHITVCELPHEPTTLAAAWAGLCQHMAQQVPGLLLLPELACIDPLWEAELFDPVRWAAAEMQSTFWLQRLPELQATHVVSTLPVRVDGRCFNQGFIWSAKDGLKPLRAKFFLPDEPGGRESRWFAKGDRVFPAFCAGDLTFGLNICTEMWALETYADYTEQGVQIILSPRATAAATKAKWLSLGVVAAVRSGAYSVSSNRVDPTGACGGTGWIISPEGKILATTTPDIPFVTIDIDIAAAAATRHCYPRYVFREEVA